MLTENAYALDHPLMEIGNYYLVQTNYAVNKSAAIHAGLEHFLLGVGPAGFNEYVKQAKRKDEYPEYFPAYDPHSIYTGTFAELGLAGVLCLVLIFYNIIRQLRQTPSLKDPAHSNLFIGMTACFIFLTLDGLVLDMLNFRHVWILIGMIGAFPMLKFANGVPR